MANSKRENELDTNCRCYHIDQHCTGAFKLFKSWDYYRYFMRKLSLKLRERGVKLLFFCIMDDHYHILVWTPHVGVTQKVLTCANTSFGKHVHNEMKFKESVFRSRPWFRAIPNKQELYGCIRYIYNNPKEAQICEPEEYRKATVNEYLTGNWYYTDKEALEEHLGMNVERLFELLENGAETAKWKNLDREEEAREFFIDPALPFLP